MIHRVLTNSELYQLDCFVKIIKEETIFESIDYLKKKPYIYAKIIDISLDNLNKNLNSIILSKTDGEVKKHIEHLVLQYLTDISEISSEPKKGTIEKNSSHQKQAIEKIKFRIKSSEFYFNHINKIIPRYNLFYPKTNVLRYFKQKKERKSIILELDSNILKMLNSL